MWLRGAADEAKQRKNKEPKNIEGGNTWKLGNKINFRSRLGNRAEN